MSKEILISKDAEPRKRKLYFVFSDDYNYNKALFDDLEEITDIIDKDVAHLEEGNDRSYSIEPVWLTEYETKQYPQFFVRLVKTANLSAHPAR